MGISAMAHVTVKLFLENEMELTIKSVESLLNDDHHLVLYDPILQQEAFRVGSVTAGTVNGESNIKATRTPEEEKWAERLLNFVKRRILPNTCCPEALAGKCILMAGSCNYQELFICLWQSCFLIVIANVLVPLEKGPHRCRCMVQRSENVRQSTLS